MAEDFGDKTEAPTPRRREEAREQGQVARSPDLTASALLLGFLLLMKSFGPGVIKALRTLMIEVLSGDSLSRVKADDVGSTLARAIVLAGGAILPLFIGAIIIAIIMNLVQVGFFFDFKRLQPNWGGLNPLRGAGRFFRLDSVVKLLMDLLKLILVGAIAWSAVASRIEQIIAIQQINFIDAFFLGASIIYAIALRIAIVLLILAILDYGYQRYRNEQQLKMTKEEIREEMRRMEGDPKIKSRRRQIAIQMATKRLRKDVPTADVIVTNPTHLAIALKYDSATMTAPKVVAKGQGFLAQRIREIAIEHGIPIIERKPLARALFKLVEVGQEIPESFYAAVAEILAYVFELSGKLKRRAAV